MISVLLVSLFKKKIECVILLCVALISRMNVVAQGDLVIKDYVQLNAIAGVGENVPFWLVSNRGGLSSLDNGYIRYGVEMDGGINNNGDWNYCSGIDLKTGYNQSYNPVVYQLYADIFLTGGLL